MEPDNKVEGEETTTPEQENTAAPEVPAEEGVAAPEVPAEGEGEVAPETPAETPEAPAQE